jgi:hypothetical protein
VVLDDGHGRCRCGIEAEHTHIRNRGPGWCRDDSNIREALRNGTADSFTAAVYDYDLDVDVLPLTLECIEAPDQVAEPVDGRDDDRERRRAHEVPDASLGPLR